MQILYRIRNSFEKRQAIASEAEERTRDFFVKVKYDEKYHVLKM